MKKGILFLFMVVASTMYLHTMEKGIVLNRNKANLELFLQTLKKHQVKGSHTVSLVDFGMNEYIGKTNCISLQLIQETVSQG